MLRLVALTFVLFASGLARAALLFPEPLCFREPEWPPRTEVKAELPCDPAGLPKKPRIFIAGEIHAYATETPGEDPRRQEEALAAIDFWKSIGRRADIGSALIAIEGQAAAREGRPYSIEDIQYLRQRGRARIPVEGELALAMAGPVHTSRFPLLLHVASSDPKYFKYVDDRMDNLFLSIADSTYLQLAWKRVKRPYADPATERTARKLDEIACAEKVSPLIAQWRKTWTNDERATRLRVLEDLYTELAKILKERSEDKAAATEIEELIVSRRYLDTDVDRYRHMVDQLSAFREKPMADNIALMYCATAHEGLDIFVQTGVNHAERLLKLVKARFQKSGLDPNLVQPLNIQDWQATQKQNATAER